MLKVTRSLINGHTGDEYNGTIFMNMISTDDTASIIQFGRSSKRLLDGNLIGQYGNGLKIVSIYVCECIRECALHKSQ